MGFWFFRRMALPCDFRTVILRLRARFQRSLFPRTLTGRMRFCAFRICRRFHRNFRYIPYCFRHGDKLLQILLFLRPPFVCLLMVDVDEIELHERFTVKDLELVEKVRTVIAFDLSPFFDPDGILGFAFHFSFLLLCFLFAFRQPWRSTGERHISQTKEEQEKKRKSLKKQSGVSDRQYVVRLISTVYCSVESPSRRQRKNTLQE